MTEFEANIQSNRAQTFFICRNFWPNFKFLLYFFSVTGYIYSSQLILSTIFSLNKFYLLSDFAKILPGISEMCLLTELLIIID